MAAGTGKNQPRSPFEWFDLGCSLRSDARFGDAVNAYAQAAEAARQLLSSGLPEDLDCAGMPALPDDKARRKALEEISSKSLASIELMQDINGFVNTDLMNP